MKCLVQVRDFDSQILRCDRPMQPLSRKVDCPDWDQQEDQLINFAPDFVIEIRSKPDALDGLKEKMQEYSENGMRLGWFIDRKHKTAFVDRADGSITQYPETATLSGEEVVPGFALALKVLL